MYFNDPLETPTSGAQPRLSDADSASKYDGAGACSPV